MNTECKPEQLEFQSLGRREVMGRFDGGRITSDGGGLLREQDRGNPLAASSTLNRLELGLPESATSDRYKRIAADSDAMDRLLVDLFLESYRKPPQEIWLDLDATDDPPEAAENRCPPAPDSAQGLAVLLGSVSLRQ
nr:transposase [Thiolapillus sp.]